MSWNQAKYQKFFVRVACPVCGSKLNGGNSQAFEDEISCATDRNHYANFFSMFVDKISILGVRFNATSIAEIEEHLDKVGNKEYK